LLNLGDTNYQPQFAYGYGLTYSDKTELAKLSEESGISADQVLNFSRYLHAGKAVNPWQLQMLDKGEVAVVTEPLQKTAGGALEAAATDRLQQEDSVLLTFNQQAALALSHAQGVALDLSRQANGDMTLELEYQVVAMAPDNAKVTIGMNCGENCKSVLDFSSYFSSMNGQGWQSLKIPLRCFSTANSAFDLTKISQPLVLEATAGFKLQLAKVRLAENEGQGQCGN